MSTAFNPRPSELQVQEQTNSHDRWFRAKVQEAIDSKKPRIPHEQVMAEMWAAVEKHAQKKTTR